MLRDDPLQKGGDVALHTPELPEGAKGQVVEWWEDVDEDGGAVNAQFQASYHQAQQGPELAVVLGEALAQGQRADDIGDGVADQRRQVHAALANFLT